MKGTILIYGGQIMNKRGAEMVEYAIVLACIAAIGLVAYGTSELSWIDDGNRNLNVGNLYTILQIVLYRIADSLDLTFGGIGG